MNRKTIVSVIAFMLCVACSTQAQTNPQVRMETSKGTMIIELDKKAAPSTVANFLAYAKSGTYDNTVFHRVIKDFMIQGGGFSVAMKQQKTRAPIQNEADNGLENNAGTIAMARTNDPNSATSQFFINVKDNAFLNHKSKTPQGWGYCVFGKVVKGMEVAQAIEKVPTGTKSGYSDVPVEPVLIKSVKLVDPSSKPKASSKSK